ncbi:hypothetical protein FOXYS1_15158 [Fusarium oxysporum]|uniref:Uncharacterized protein n=1 Tax=Fusarium oxysporum TaxID=5507 RepID=A0A8H4ZI98_FUSOX|nr:hypothetical protein FOXYS1_15158 [Fusarium oxysporum]
MLGQQSAARQRGITKDNTGGSHKSFFYLIVTIVKMSLAVPITIARTLTRDQALERALEFAHRHGLFQVLTQWTQRRASRQQEQTYQEIRDALPQSLNCIQAREIRAIANAFNSTPAFLAYFQAAALGSIPLVLLDLASAIRESVQASMPYDPN